jgi:hypothetical protein
MGRKASSVSRLLGETVGSLTFAGSTPRRPRNRDLPDRI